MVLPLWTQAGLLTLRADSQRDPIKAGWAALGRGNRAQARDDFLIACKRHPERLESWTAALHATRGQKERAVLRGLFESTHGPPTSLAWRSIEAALTGDWGFREQRLRALIAEAGPKAVAHLPLTAIGDLFLRRGNAQAAIHSYQRALDHDPGAHLALIGITRSLVALDRLNDAVSPAKLWLRAHPEDGITLYNLGCIQLRRRRSPQKALDAFRKARRILPKDLDVLLGIGAAAMSLKKAKPEVAREALQAALTIAPRSTPLRWNLALLYADHLGDAATAISHLRAYLTLGGSDESRARSWLAELERKAAGR